MDAFLREAYPAVWRHLEVEKVSVPRRGAAAAPPAPAVAAAAVAATAAAAAVAAPVQQRQRQRGGLRFNKHGWFSIVHYGSAARPAAQQRRL